MEGHARVLSMVKRVETDPVMTYANHGAPPHLEYVTGCAAA